MVKKSTCQCRRGKRLRFDLWVGKIPWRRKWQTTPVFLPGESHGQSLLGYSLWGHKESDTTEHTGAVWLYIQTQREQERGRVTYGCTYVCVYTSLLPKHSLNSQTRKFVLCLQYCFLCPVVNSHTIRQ